MHFITLYFILIYQIRCGLSSVKFSLVWKISFSDRFYWFLCSQSGVGMLFVTLKFRKKKPRKKQFFADIPRYNHDWNPRYNGNIFIRFIWAITYTFTIPLKKTVWILVYWSEVEKKSIVKLKVYKSGYNRYFWWHPWY